MNRTLRGIWDKCQQYKVVKTEITQFLTRGAWSAAIWKSPAGAALLFPITNLSEMHKIKVVTVLCSSPAHFGTSPKDDSDSWSSAVLSPCSIIAGFGLGSWEMSSAFNRDKAGWYLQSPSHPLHWPRSFRLTDKYSCKDSKVSFPLQEYCSKPLKSGVHQSCLLCPELPRVEI